ncbi:LysE family translocator [uncultured Psychromonas sp.]|uniref:LysE family translocator n=1 Tax=uncultured Psychromonas sp. TaxID=173974 RepID=UPI002637E210|nr:LysE family translocator [uncultured Psychromonas sp.]
MNDTYQFVLIALFLVISPGANMILVLKTVSTQGQYAGLLNVSGFVLGAFIHGTLSILGLSAIIVQSAELFLLVKIIGSIYLLYLGIKTIYQSFKVTSPQSSIVTSKTKVRMNSLKSFREGFLTQMLNPKGSMFYLSVFPQFIDFQSHAYLAAFSLVSIHAGLMVLWFGSACIVASRIKLLGGRGQVGRWVQRFCGSILLALSVLLLKQKV